MSGVDTFHDTNVVLYLVSGDREKADRAEQLIAAGGTLSVQVLNEFVSVASKKFRMPWHEIRTTLRGTRKVCRVQGLTPETHDRAMRLVHRHGIDIYDATIVASALLAGCSVLYSEDFQHGQVFEGRLRVVNPFAD